MEALHGFHATCNTPTPDRFVKVSPFFSNRRIDFDRKLPKLELKCNTRVEKNATLPLHATLFLCRVALA